MPPVGPGLPLLSPPREELHSLAGRGNLVPADVKLAADLDVSVRAEDSQIMGLRHRRNPVERVPFHPESLLTTQGKALLKNFLALPRPA